MLGSTGSGCRWPGTYFVYLLMCVTGSQAQVHSAFDEESYCEGLTFEPKCSDDEVVVIGKALYGRMRLGKCVKTDYGSVGCKADVLPKVDSRCSGRRTCEIRIPDTTLDETRPCPTEFKTYLEANYTCVTVSSAACMQCDTLHSARVTGPNGYIASIDSDNSVNPVGCGTTRCPWSIEVPEGQRINLTLFDFTLSSSTSLYSPETCVRYALVKEPGKERDTPACAGKGRVSHLYLSTGNQVEIHVVSPEVFSQRGQFLFYYEAVGCPKYVAPLHAWAGDPEGDTLTVSCLANKDSWVLTCDGTQWTGKVGTCPDDFAHASKSSAHTITLPLGVLIAIIVGIALVIGVFILTIGLVCLKRRQAAAAQYRRPTEQSYYGRGRTSSSGFHEDMSDATPLQYAKKDRSSPDIQKRRLPVPGGIRENVYMEQRPLPSIPDLHEELDDDKSDRSSKVQVYRTPSGREHYHNPRLVVNMRNEPHPPHPPSTGSDPPYFVLDPDELGPETPSGHNSLNGSASGRIGRGGVRSDKQKSPEEENAENFCKEVGSFNNSCHEIPPIPSVQLLSGAGNENNKGNCSWP